MKDYYEILGLDDSATADDIKASFKRLTVMLHPDHTGDNSPKAIDKLRDVYEAKKILSDPVSRAQYDRQYYVEMVNQFKKETPAAKEDWLVGLSDDKFEAFRTAMIRSAADLHVLNNIMQLREDMINFLDLCDKGASKADIKEGLDGYSERELNLMSKLVANRGNHEIKSKPSMTEDTKKEIEEDLAKYREIFHEKIAEVKAEAAPVVRAEEGSPRPK